MDICHDYSYWRNRCYQVSDEKRNIYTHAIQCSTYDTTKSVEELGNDCSNSWGLITGSKLNCPNSSTKKSCTEKGNGFFYCQISKTCIENIKVCDGVVHCIKGEDEDLDTCKPFFSEMFPKDATVECIEANRTYYDIIIKAIPCNGIMECENGEDEGWYCQNAIVRLKITLVCRSIYLLKINF